SHTDALKKLQIREYGYDDTRPSMYEEDHLIPLALGGHPNDPWKPGRNSHIRRTQKTRSKTNLHRKVCLDHEIYLRWSAQPGTQKGETHRLSRAGLFER